MCLGLPQCTENAYTHYQNSNCHLVVSGLLEVLLMTSDETSRKIESGCSKLEHMATLLFICHGVIKGLLNLTLHIMASHLR